MRTGDGGTIPLERRGSLRSSDNGSWGQLFDEAGQAVAILSVSRIRRIEEIKEALKEGRYRIDGRQIAEKMVSDAVRRLRERIR
jgi:anti-sigma28 factor (negative regulator of flagellin synthesis)